MISLMPGFLVRFFLWLTALFSYTLNIRFPGIPRDPFGGCILTNVGMFGLDVAYAPLVPYSRVPLILLVGEAKKRPVVVGDKLEVREVVTVNATVDHRFCDGALLGKMVKVVREAFDDPGTHFGAGTPGAPGAA
jgi:pyruvate dehydrogenase E2 component (dihydrolipoamide acetyltransferase)